METTKKFRSALMLLLLILTAATANAVSLWVGESYTWDFGGSVMGSTYNMSVTPNGGYLSVTGSGFYRTIKPTQYFSGNATVTAEWDYTLYYGDTMHHQKVTLTVSCKENPVSIYPTTLTLSPGETYQLGYSHTYNNEYVGAANAYFSGENSHFTVTSSGLITAISPGEGYVNVYSKISSAANAPACYVKIKEVEPTGASISDVNVLADQSTELNVSVSPSNASVKSKTWHIKSGSDAVSISGDRLTGLKPGQAVIYCMVNGSVRSNDATVYVSEPKLKSASTMPENNASDVSVFTNPSVTYSHSIFENDGFKSISFTCGGVAIDGSVELGDRTITFLPVKVLAPNTSYKFHIPANAIKNKWGSPTQSDVDLVFTTGDLEKATLSMTPSSGSYITKGEGVKLSATPSDAVIYYTTDGSTPTMQSSVYKDKILIDTDCTVKAFASREGYKDSEVVTGEYYKSQSEITAYMPNDTYPLFNYRPFVPHVKLSGTVVKSNNFRRITMTDETGNTVAGTPYVTNYIISFVPDSPLENCRKYTVDIPRDAVKAANGEVFKGFSWTFTTPTLPSVAEMRGDESVFVLYEDGQLHMRGMDYQTVNANEGSFSFKDYDTMTKKMVDVEDFSAGYTHSLIADGTTVKGDGFALCGETGSASSLSAIEAIKILKAGFQTSAIIDGDNNLWMCGRNDFYQLGDGTGTTTEDFAKVAENVADVALGNGFTLYVDTDNVLWSVGRNHKGQLGDGTRTDRSQPVKVLEDVANVYASSSGFFAACVMNDGKLMTWGDNSNGQLGRDCGKYALVPEAVLEGVVSASLGEAHALALNDKFEAYSWGSNIDGQIALSGSKIERPTLMAENIKAVNASSHTSLLLANSGRITGWGRKTHSNLGSGSGKASGVEVVDGNRCLRLESALIQPTYYEVEPESNFALIALTQPLASDYETVEWSTDNPEVAQVDGSGVIRTESEGEAMITVKFTDRFGKSVSADAKILCTDNPDNSGVAAVILNDSWYAYSNRDSIMVENATPGCEYILYNVQGYEIQRNVATERILRFGVSTPGIYIVRSQNRAVKVALD